VRTVLTGNCTTQVRPIGAAATQGADAFQKETAVDPALPASPLVVQASIGPYDYAVLKADNKEAMLKWLADNRYFVPTGTQDAVGPYVQPGAFFLALKLKSGQPTGSIQPVVLEYPSQLPMIPIILTSVAAQPNMGVQVWVVGKGRAIPRNYNHVVLNDSQLDWLQGAPNYNDVVIKAVAEAPGKHAFVTEYAGRADVMKDQLAPRTRFGELGALAAQASPQAFVKFLFDRGFAVAGVLPPTLRSLVLSAIPLPAPLKGKVVEVTGFATTAVTEDVFLSNLSFFLGEYRTRNPALFVGFPATFDAPALAREVHEKIVKPAREAQALLDTYEWLTRLYTTLSPQDMSKDPVFSFNPALPTVSREHTASMEVNCGLSGDQFTSPARLITEQGWVTRFPLGRANPAEAPTRFADTPFALRIETLGEEGLPKVLTDNTSPISKVNGCGCATDPSVVMVVSLLWLARRRVARR